jgi:hypothetical protein
VTRRARFLVLPLALVALLLPAAPASSSLSLVGFTWYSDGTYTRSAPSGTVITAYATGARPNKPFKLQTSAIRGAFPCSDVLLYDVNPNVRMSNSSGVIGYTSGPINLPVGSYEVCFYELPRLESGHAPTATAPAYFSVV